MSTTPEAINDDVVVVRSPSTMSAELGTDWAMLDIERGLYYGAGDVAARIWTLLESPVSVGALKAALLTTYEVDEETLSGDVRGFLVDLIQRGLVDAS